MKLAPLFFLGFFFLLPLFSESQSQWVPEELEGRFHSKEGLPWFMNDGRPDSLDVLSYDVALSAFDRKRKSFRGECTIRFRSLVEGLDELRWDLAGFEVKDVRAKKEDLPFQREGERLYVTLHSPMKKGDTSEMTIRYSGQPVIDETGWGGTYFREGMVFNLGVGFGAKPHSYGRTWFPCVDHFRERATYRFNVRTRKDEKAVCSGVLEEKEEVEGGFEWHWEMDKEVPPYLVSFAVGDLITLRDEFESVSGKKVPVRLDLPAEDSAEALRSFSRLEEAFSYFEAKYGPYRWPRVGYVAVPFPSGAMEHATNIAYPQAAVNGTRSSEDLMSHELAHSWWGNLLTCATPWDMWINEGMASFSEFLFLEGVEGDEAYRQAVRENHKKVLHTAHLRDGKRMAVYGIPHENTYGGHVYDKGADVVRTFRYLLGDSLFFSALKQTLREHPYENMPTHRLGELWQEHTGRPVERYFEDFLLKPGFPHFRVARWEAEDLEEGSKVSLEIEQRMTDANEAYSHVPLELFFLGPNGEEHRDTLMVSHRSESSEFRLPFVPVHVSADPSGKIAQAALMDTARISEKGAHSFDHVGGRLEINKLEDEAFVELRQHYLSPELDDLARAEREISNERYWSFQGTISEDSSNSVLFRFDGRQQNGVHPEASFFSGMDPIDESELYVIRRPPGEKEWIRCASCSIEEGDSASDGKGMIRVEGGKKGSFVLVRDQ